MTKNRYIVLSRFDKDLLEEDVKAAKLLGWDILLDGQRSYTQEVEGQQVTIYDQAMIKRSKGHPLS